MIKKKSWKLGTKLVVKSICILSAIMIAAFAVIILTNAQTSKENAANNLNSLAESDAATIAAKLQEPLDTARALAHSMQGYKDVADENRRSFYDSIMKSVLQSNESYLGIWACWDPNALDGMDNHYAYSSASDSTGRYIPYWVRESGKIELIPLEGYESSDYYLLAKTSGIETILNPYTYEINGSNVLLTSVCEPIKDESGKVVGVTGIDLALSDLQSITFNNGGYKSTNTYLLSNNGTYVISPDKNAVGKTLSEIKQGNAEAIMNAITQGKSYMQDGASQVSGENVKSVFASVNIGSTSTPWSVAVEVDNSEVMASTVQMVYMMIIILFLLLAVIAAALLIIVKFSISRPLKETADFAKELASGNLDGLITIKSNDEIGQLKGILDKEVRGAFKNITQMQAVSDKQRRYQREEVDKLVVNLERLSSGELYCDMAAQEPDEDTKDLYELYSRISENLHLTVNTLKTYISEISGTLAAMSAGDFSVSIESDYCGEFVALKESINTIAESLSRMVSEINIAADQVAAGTKQVSDGSQAISQGATEQAGAIEELSATFTQIAAQTKQNAENASKASGIADNAKKGAAEGNMQMKSLQTAMSEINESSASISKIIKVIDDIAFQTNILALNAAVEAARAGVHGKGFAVVAEEVRNLAARSANAAKETTSLIEGSIKKTEAGTDIADETARALEAIVEGVERAAELMVQIAAASNEQATGIGQVNNGIDQLSQVVQTNSATSEETAAAAEELSSQAELLKQMVSRFTLGEKDTAPAHIKEQPVSEAQPKKAGPRIVLNDKEYGKY